MTEYHNEIFQSRIDRGGRIVESMRFVDCQFVNCAFSLSRDVSHQSIVRDAILTNCHACGCHVGPGVLENVTVEGLTTDRALTLWSTFLRHLIFVGDIGRVIITRSAMATDRDRDIQRQFEEARAAFYAETDWAIDISNARFQELDICGIPAEKIRVNPERHFVVRRDRVLKDDWRKMVPTDNQYWIDVIDLFIQDGDQSTVLVVPKEQTGREKEQLTEGLLRLRDLGVVD